MTPQQISIATGTSVSVAATWLQPIVAACTRFQINTPRRQAAFLSQIGVESGGLAHLVENLNYSEEALLAMWPDRFDAHSAAISTSGDEGRRLPEGWLWIMTEAWEK